MPTSFMIARAWFSARTAAALTALVLMVSAALLAFNPAPAFAAYGAMHMPTSGIITSKVNWRCPGSDTHAGYDIANSRGTPIYAAYRGRVVSAGWDGGYGRAVVIDHIEGYRTRYAHLSGFRVEVGQHVTREQRIGSMGSSGNSTGPHLHFEIRRFGNPLKKFGEYPCGSHVTAQRAIQARFPDLPD